MESQRDIPPLDYIYFYIENNCNIHPKKISGRSSISLEGSDACMKKCVVELVEQ